MTNRALDLAADPTRPRMPTARTYFFPRTPLDDRRQREADEDFFRALRLPNGTYKTTAAGRMPDVDEAIARTVGASASVQLLDVGVSSGVTTADLLDTLARHGVGVDTVAVDITIEASLRRIAPGIDALSIADGSVVQLATPLGAKGRPHDPSGSAKRAMLQRVFEWAERRLATMPESAATRVRLLSPRLAQRPSVCVVEQDITIHRPEWTRRFDVVRAANLINLDYFDGATLTTMLANLTDYVRPGGILAVCRTIADRSNDASLFRRGDAGLEVVERIGRGSEVEALALVPEGDAA